MEDNHRKSQKQTNRHSRDYNNQGKDQQLEEKSVYQKHKQVYHSGCRFYFIDLQLNKYVSTWE